MQRWKTLAAALIVLATGCQTSTPTVPQGWEPVHFLAGCWRAQGSDGTSIEVWTEPHGNTMFGQNHSLSGGRLSFFELLAIERRGEAFVYVARPRGGAPTEFSMTASDAGSVTFENAAHDFPKRIHYEILPSGDLSAIVDGGADAKGDRKLELRWQPVR